MNQIKAYLFARVGGRVRSFLYCIIYSMTTRSRGIEFHAIIVLLLVSIIFLFCFPIPPF